MLGLLLWLAFGLFCLTIFGLGVALFILIAVRGLKGLIAQNQQQGPPQ